MYSVKTTQRTLTRGMKALKETLGPDEALRFVVAVERAEGDSVALFKNLMADKTVDQIDREISSAKKRI